jgi:hypothetical protein
MKKNIFLLSLILTFISCDKDNDVKLVSKLCDIKYETKGKGVYELAWYNHSWNKSYVSDNFAISDSYEKGDTMIIAAYGNEDSVFLLIHVSDKCVRDTVIAPGSFGTISYIIPKTQ